MEIRALLQQQVELLQQMCAFLEREYDILKHGKPQDLALLVEVKQELQQKIELSEKKRLQLMGETTLTEYERTNPGETELAKQYRTLLPKISELIEKNQVITEMGLTHYNGMLELISSSAEEKVQTYGQRGYMSKKEVKTSALLNRQA